jgi:hypothetical protein
MYSTLPNEAVEQTRNPPSKMAAGKMTFKWDMTPPQLKEAIASPRAYSQRSSGFAGVSPVRLGAIPPETAAHCAN